MSRCVKGRDAKLKCFYRVLAFDPQNKHATKGINALGGGEAKGSPAASPRVQGRVQSSPPSHQPSGKKSKRRWLIGLVVAPIALCVCTFVSLAFLGRSSVDDAEGGGSTTQSSRTWVVYRVRNSTRNSYPLNIDAGPVSLTWENNTGGTNQRDALIGPKRCFASDGVTCSDPFSVGYTMSTGDFAYISAQLDGESRGGKLTCDIYLTDDAGVDDLIENYFISPETTLWKSASCSGDYCICTASGIVGFD